MDREHLAASLARYLAAIYPEIDNVWSLEGTLNNFLMDYEEEERKAEKGE